MLPLTDRCRRALRFAQREVEAMGHDYVGSAHILLGLLSEREGVAARALGSLGFHSEEVTKQVRGLRGAQERAAEPSRLSRPAKMAVECALQEAHLLGHSHADTEHLLLGLMRATHTHPDTAFMRIVGFEDQLRIRNEILRLVARPPNPAEVARRKATHAAGPHSEFEAYALNVLRDALKKIPAARAPAIKSLTLHLSFEHDNREQPLINAQWDTGVGAPGVERIGSHGVRIPRSASNDQHGAELRRKWVHEVSSAPQHIDGVVSPKWTGEIDSALSLLASSLARLLHKSDMLSEVLGHGIPILITPPAPQRTPETRNPN